MFFISHNFPYPKVDTDPRVYQGINSTICHSQPVTAEVGGYD